MEVDELLAYKPPQAPKRPLEEEESEKDEVEVRQTSKMRHMAKKKAEQIIRSSAPFAEESSVNENDKIDILKYVENEEPEGDVLDEAGLKRLILMLEKRVLKNQELRIKFPEAPDKFMESEVELHQTIQELHAVATTPDLYPILVSLNAVNSLLELLSHQNTDIAVAVVDLLQEITDVDVLHESREGADELIGALTEQQATALLVQNLERLDEKVKEEAEGVHNTLAIFENLTEYLPEICDDVSKQGLLAWLLKRLKLKAPFDANKLYCSEILSILIQDSPENRQLLGDLDGIDTLLQQLAVYKKHDPASAEEQELMENLFNCLCSSLMQTSNRDKFLKGEGLQLMNLMLREKKLSRSGSLKVLDHAMSGIDGKDNCSKFVDILGLRSIFPLFMKTPKQKKRLLTANEHEEHVVSIISSMLRNCRGSQRQRLLSKFTENDHEKVDRLLELHFKYLDKVEEIDATIEQKKTAATDEDDDAIYMQRLSGGLFTLQLVDYIILEVCSSAASSIKARVMQILSQRGASVKTIRHVMREYAGNLGDAGSSEWREQEQQHILQLVDKF
ncbi:beta-catenin-like protein 1 isoform X2 [Ctenocephalides felis]|uniref:beta-catenin-like protein 1 isoform X2 n=1 Tax=Ctenocephalides felis TaxID=7515 RepID=UPI000E6E530D|nr:beta-catenin-like protein 1 isoform X2 [Ctenocephalides felis]